MKFLKKTSLAVLLLMAMAMLFQVTTLAASYWLDTPTAAEIVKQFVVDDPHHGEYCTEDADTVREFGEGTDYGPIMTNGIEDPLFAKGGYLFGATDQGKLKIYAIAVDFTDAVGDMQIAYGRHRNVVKSAYGGTIFDFSDPQIHFESQFMGTTALKANPKFTWLGTDAQEFKGIKQVLEEQSLGRLEVEVELLNERLADATGIDTSVERTPWFHIDGPIFAYSDAGPADCEDYRQFARLYQAAIDAAVSQLEEAGLNADVLGEGSNIEDIGFIYVITPFNAFGYRLGFQGGGGIMSSYSFNEQALTQRDSEYRHVPGVLTPGGRMVGSGVFGMKGIVNPGNSNSISPNIGNALHELTHGLGMFDDYSYGSMGTNSGESTTSGVGNWGVMGSNSRSVSPDPPAWRKYRLGWLEDEEITVVMPGDDTTDIYLRALGSAPGIDGGDYTDDPGITTRMIVIPKEYRTRDTYGVDWNNGWNPFKNNYNWYDWFTNIFVGGETYSLKSFPTYYTLESRKALGADGNPLGSYSGLPDSRTGLVIDYVANPTWETGHGAGGFKVMTGDNGLKEGAVWTDPNLGLTITVLEAGSFYDKVRVAYTGIPTNSAKHVYLGLLKASDSYVSKNPGNEFTVDFNLTTLGTPAPNDSANNATTLSTVMRVATPLAVSGGVSGFEVEVSFDPDNFEFVSAGSAPFTYEIDTKEADKGTLLIKAAGDEMIDKDTILSLNFQTKTATEAGAYTISAKITDVTLLNWRNETLVKGDPGFDGVGTFGNGSIAALYNTVASNVLSSEDIKSTGGKITVSDIATYTISGSIVCDTPGPAEGSWIGVESSVVLYDNEDKVVARTNSDWDGNFTIKGVPAASGYYLIAEKSKYDTGISADFAVSDANLVLPELQLLRSTYPVSGTIYGAAKSDGSDKTPLAGVDVYVLSIGNGYRVLGGPVKTDDLGRYTVYATTDSADSNFAGIAVKAEGNAARYGTQITLFAKDDLKGNQVGDLNLNMGTQTHLILDDWIYPENNTQLGAEGTFAFSLGGADSQVVTGRDLTLTETQDVHIRTVTKSTGIYYQLRRLDDGTAVGDKVRSVGTTNGDDLIRNVPKGQYYIELTRDGYVSLNTMPFTVDTTRVLLRDAQTTNTMDMNTLLGANVVSGKVIDSTTGAALDDVTIIFQSWSNTGGMGNPITTGDDGTFSYDVLADDKDIIFSKEGYLSQAINIASGGASGLVIELAPDYSAETYLEIASVTVAPGDTVDVTYSIRANIYGFTTFSIDIPYNSSIYSPQTITAQSTLDNPAIGNIIAINPKLNGSDTIRVAFASSAKVQGDITLFTVTYKVEPATPPMEIILSAENIIAKLNSEADNFVDVNLIATPGLMVIGLLGDVNGDGQVTVEDAILLLQMYVGLIDWTQRAQLIGDLNKDNKIDPTDAALILRIAVGG